MQTEGKITEIKLGFGGQGNKQIGATFVFDTNMGIMTMFVGYWSMAVEANEVERNRQFANMIRMLDSLLLDAKVTSLDKLVNVPVLCEYSGGTVLYFRVLTEAMRQ